MTVNTPRWSSRVVLGVLALALASPFASPSPAVASPSGWNVQGFTARAQDQSGDDYVLAGGHPYEATATFSLGSAGGPFEQLKSVFTELPPGFVGNVATTARCTAKQLLVPPASICPAASQVGIVRISVPGDPDHPFALYNMVPGRGYPAQFGFIVFTKAITVFPQLRPRTGQYGVTVASPGATQINATGISVTLFGMPSERNGTGGVSVPLLSNPSDCLVAQPLSRVTVDSWSHPGQTVIDGLAEFGSPVRSDPNWKSETANAPPVTGCDAPALASQFGPSIDARPTPGAGTTQADAPSGYTVDLDFPQTNDPTDSSSPADPSLPSAPPLRDATVTLPAGVAISPSAADGLDGCSDVGVDDQVHYDNTLPVSCPGGSKIGSVIATSPLLAERDPSTDEVTSADPISGDVFILKPHPGDLDPAGAQDGSFRLLIQINSPKYGVNVKLPGIATADRATGRLTAVFEDNPQLPVKHLTLVFKAGDRAPLVNPTSCGPATTNGTFTPWSRGGTRSDGVVVPGTPNATSSSSFDVSWDGHGAACPGTLPFAPALSAGVADTQAGASSPFSFDLSREDRTDVISGVNVTLPGGLVGAVGSVPLCSDADANAGTCPAESRVGTATVAAGSGANPYYIADQPVSLTGGYKGAPYGLAIAVHAQAGPFDLGTVVVRQQLQVDNHDAHVTVVSDPIPTIRDGVPLRVKRIHVAIDRPGFMRSPTSCDAKSIDADVQGATGTSAHVSSAFGVSGCSSLPFEPTFTAQTRGKLAFKKGAELNVHIAMPSGDANIKSVETTLPKGLPSRLIPTINNACVIDVFRADYTKCPEDSFVGTVTAVSPILDQPLKGPVYIVAPPNDVPRLEIVLLGQGSAAGIRVDLEGDVIVDIGDGRSRATFDTVPDVPITSFDLSLPSGPHSILDAPSGDLCAAPVQLFLRITGQNGKTDDGYKTAKVTDCPKIAKAKVVSAKASNGSVQLRVLAPAEGRLVVSGSGLKAVGREVNRRLTYSVTVPLSPAGAKALAKKGRLKVRPTVWFKPVNAAKASTVKTKTLTIGKHAATGKKHAVKKRSDRFWIGW